jgi:hypothetical protein
VSTEVAKLLLSVVEQGGYPNFTADYQSLGLQTEVVTSVRKASGVIKKATPDFVVAEFNVTSNFRDRVSNIESLLAKIQSDSPSTKAIIFYEKQDVELLKVLRERFTIDESLTFPVDKEKLLNFIASSL